MGLAMGLGQQASIKPWSVTFESVMGRRPLCERSERRLRCSPRQTLYSILEPLRRSLELGEQGEAAAQVSLMQHHGVRSWCPPRLEIRRPRAEESPRARVCGLRLGQWPYATASDRGLVRIERGEAQA